MNDKLSVYLEMDIDQEEFQSLKKTFGKEVNFLNSSKEELIGLLQIEFDASSLSKDYILSKITASGIAVISESKIDSF